MRGRDKIRLHARLMCLEATGLEYWLTLFCIGWRYRQIGQGATLSAGTLYSSSRYEMISQLLHADTLSRVCVRRFLLNFTGFDSTNRNSTQQSGGKPRIARYLGIWAIGRNATFNSQDEPAISCASKEEYPNVVIIHCTIKTSLQQWQIFFSTNRLLILRVSKRLV